MVRVFISWSGGKSHDVAELLDEWLQCVLQAVRPWRSSKHIDRGALWFSEIGDQLKDTTMGIVCLTKSNKEKPWILFEAGALAKGLKSSRVCTFLIDLDSTDVSNPLAQFNHTMPTREGVLHLVSTLNSGLGDAALSDKVLEQVFDTYWPQFEEKFMVIASKPEEHAPSMERSEEDVIVEVLRTVRSMDRRMRDLESEAQGRIKHRGLARGRHDLKRLVETYFQHGIPAEAILDRFHGEFPKHLLLEIIEECERESSGDNTSA